MDQKPLVRLEFHISRQARDRYQFDKSLFSFSGNVIFANFHAARLFAQKMNARRDLISFPEQAVRAGQVNAMGLIDEIMHLVVSQYRQQRKPAVMGEALSWLESNLGAGAVQSTLHRFCEEFPPLAVYRGDLSVDAYLDSESLQETGLLVSNRQIVLEELLMLWLANANLAFSPYLELFDDENLEKFTAYSPLIASLHTFFDTQPFFGPDNQNLIDMLRAPALAVPHSLTGQLEFIRSRWGSVLGKYLYRLLSSLDLIKEEEKAIFGFGGQGPSYVLEYTGLEAELERFSPDKDWMPNLVLIAKNTYVWMEQLSRKYQRWINRLNLIPDEELDRLARWGFSGLWLIGLWERSPASQTIKQMRGNPDAVASAYSLFSYEIAADLGGEEAYQDLRDRAWKRGIRLASDMVPNHMGIDSRWVIEHPDWFISLDYSPFPSYSFNGPNLSWDQRVGIYLDDHYYNNSDAAVVFKRVDHHTGSTKYIYHGNDGTSMPWNDTAQLNYLIHEVREAVIQTILQVARKFPVIRFDAAMTLAKRHYQRLWFPEPGSGGDIPSRADHGLAKSQFDQVFPQEFWREVVDRVAQEVPDTLLLAEAFWLMEGYFVRTLGMHRVYNSAFMNMLRDEKNQEYRLVIKNTMEFDPEILQRFVNFMNNPDERTSVDQFGNGDKYFGVCTLMATMPGLPMFGHGQVQGYTEKYGMEFKKPILDEHPDDSLVERHEREIFPLLRRRYLFAKATNFLLYDFFTPEGYVNEDVFAYSNRAGSERVLVLYHNKFANTRGWVRMSTPYPIKTGLGEERLLVQKSLGEGMDLQDDPNCYSLFRDHVTGLEYIRNNRELVQQGLYIELEAYKYRVFLDFREVADDEAHRYAQLAAYLGGRGVPSIADAMKEIFLQPVHTPFRELVNAGMFRWLTDLRSPPPVVGLKPAKTPSLADLPKALDEAYWKMNALLEEVKLLVGGQGDPAAIASEVCLELGSALGLSALGKENLPAKKDSRKKAAPLEVAFDPEALKYLQAGPAGRMPLPDANPAVWGALLGWLFIHKLGKILLETDYAEQSRTWIDELLLGKILASVLQDLGLDESAAWRSVSLVRLLCSHQDWCDPQAPAQKQAYRALQSWLADGEVQHFLHVNRYQGVLWFNKESFEELLWWMFVVALLENCSSASAEAAQAIDPGSFAACYQVIQRLQLAAAASAYQLDKLLEAAV